MYYSATQEFLLNFLLKNFVKSATLRRYSEMSGTPKNTGLRQSQIFLKICGTPKQLFLF